MKKSVGSSSEGGSGVGGIPWDALRTLMSSCLYGARIDNEFDQKLLVALMQRLFGEQCFSAEFCLVGGDKKSEENDNGATSEDRVVLSDCAKRAEYVEWVAQMRLAQKPSWLGLPNNAEKLLLRSLGKSINGLFNYNWRSLNLATTMLGVFGAHIKKKTAMRGLNFSISSYDYFTLHKQQVCGLMDNPHTQHLVTTS